MEPLISLPESTLLKLMASHAVLSQAEYHRNPAFNDAHFAFKAEDAVLDDLAYRGVATPEFFARLETHILSLKEN